MAIKLVLLLAKQFLIWLLVFFPSPLRKFLICTTHPSDPINTALVKKNESQVLIAYSTWPLLFLIPSITTLIMHWSLLSKDLVPFTISDPGILSSYTFLVLLVGQLHRIRNCILPVSYQYYCVLSFNWHIEGPRLKTLYLLLHFIATFCLRLVSYCFSPSRVQS